MYSFAQELVYTKEYLSPQARARALVEDRKLEVAWTSDCKVMVELTPDHRHFRVKKLQLEGLLQRNNQQPLPTKLDRIHFLHQTRLSCVTSLATAQFLVFS